MFNFINLIVAIIVIIGAINWGAVAGLNMDLVKLVTPGYPSIEMYIKIAVGLAGVYYAYLIYSWKTHSHKAEVTEAPKPVA